MTNASQYALRLEFDPTETSLHLFTLLSIPKYLYTSAKPCGTAISFGSVGHGRRAPPVIRYLDGLEEITVLPSAWRLRTRHESQKKNKRRHVAGSHSVLALFLSLIAQARKIRARQNPKSNFDDRSEPLRSQVPAAMSIMSLSPKIYSHQPYMGIVLQAKTYCKS